MAICSLKIIFIGAYSLLSALLALKRNCIVRLYPHIGSISIALVVFVTHLQIQMNLLSSLLNLIGIYSLLPLLLIGQVQENKKWRSTLAAFVLL